LYFPSLAILIGAYSFSEGADTLLNDLAGSVGNLRLGKVPTIVLIIFLQGYSTDSTPDTYSPEWMQNVVLHL